MTNNISIFCRIVKPTYFLFIHDFLLNHCGKTAIINEVSQLEIFVEIVLHSELGVDKLKYCCASVVKSLTRALSLPHSHAVPRRSREISDSALWKNS